MDTKISDTMPPKFSKVALTFDDVSLVPGESNVLPNAVDTSTQLTRHIRQWILLYLVNIFYRDQSTQTKIFIDDR